MDPPITFQPLDQRFPDLGRRGQAGDQDDVATLALNPHMKAARVEIGMDVTMAPGRMGGAG